MNSAHKSVSSVHRTTHTTFFNQYIIKNRVSYTEPCASGGHSHRAFSGFLQGSTRVREETSVLLISAFWLNVLWTEISTKWTRCATPNHHIPRYSPQIIPSVCSVPFWERSAEPKEGNILGLCVYLGRFHCRELFLRAGFYVHSRLQLRQRRWEFAADRKVKKRPSSFIKRLSD